MSIIFWLFGIPIGLWGCYALLPTLWCKYGSKRFKQVNTAPKEKSLGKKALFLTFDDGPHPLYTSRLLDLLAQQGVQATFFVLAENAARYPALLQRMQAEGHSVALHGCGHGNMWLMDPRRTRQSLEQGLLILGRQGVRPRYYRPPYGNVNLCTLYYARRFGLRLLLWDVMVGDWRADAEVPGLVNKLDSGVQEQAVICLHDNGAGQAVPGAPLKTIAALAAFIPHCQGQGYRFCLPAAAGERGIVA